jgi:hypothetical protein
LLFVWDDDDIFLPWRLSYSVGSMRDGQRFFKPAESFILSAGKLSGPHRNVFHSSSCWERGLFNEVNGYPHMGSGEDQALENKFAKVLARTLSDEIQTDRIFYIYRWAGIGTYHLSALAQTCKQDESDQDLVEDYVMAQIGRGEVPVGQILLQPHWQIDYCAAAADYAAATVSSR